MPAAIYEGKATFMALLKNWFWSYIGNLAGSLFIVFMVDETLLIHGAAAPSGLANAMAVSVAKTTAPWGNTLALTSSSPICSCFGMKLGSSASVGAYIWRSMIPVYIGNTLSAAILVALSYACMYGRYGAWLDASLKGMTPSGWGKRTGTMTASSSATSLKQTSITEEPHAEGKV
ncbi:hypothetical protein WJX81_007955 [Elliptochloris bilobata]|uniref:Uncharacterized protein n=1 Tax=Elliptochloris bilobata TaxID=381761 RepID=A0AAW1R3H9_9CHLO